MIDCTWSYKNYFKFKLDYIKKGEMKWTQLDDRSGKIWEWNNSMSGTYFMSRCKYHFQLTAYILPTAITGSESLMQYKATQSNLLSDATQKRRFYFLVKMPNGCLVLCIPFICSHKLTNSVNTYCRWSGVLLDPSL